MALSVFFTDYLDEVLRISSFDEESKKNLKADLVNTWVERSGQRILEILTPEETQKLSSVAGQAASLSSQQLAEELGKMNSSLVNDREKQEKIVAIYSEEAEKILGKITDTFVQNTDLQKQQELAEALGNLETKAANTP